MGDEPRKLIAIRLDVKGVGYAKQPRKKGVPYQSLVNEIVARGDAEGELATGRGPTFMWRKDGRCSDELIVAGRYLAT